MTKWATKVHLMPTFQSQPTLQPELGLALHVRFVQVDAEDESTVNPPVRDAVRNIELHRIPRFSGIAQGASLDIASAATRASN